MNKIFMCLGIICLLGCTAPPPPDLKDVADVVERTVPGHSYTITRKYQEWKSGKTETNVIVFYKNGSSAEGINADNLERLEKLLKVYFVEE